MTSLATVERVSNIAAELFREGKFKKFVDAVYAALDRVNITDNVARKEVFSKVCSLLSKRGAAKRAAEKARHNHGW